jgi:hypothetical protein
MAVHLTQGDIEFVESTGIEKIKESAYHFVRTKLISCEPIPDKGHPVFKAMGAIGANNPKNLERNFGISCGKSPSEEQVGVLVENIMGWLRGEIQNSGKIQAKIKEF